MCLDDGRGFYPKALGNFQLASTSGGLQESAVNHAHFGQIMGEVLSTSQNAWYGLISCLVLCRPCLFQCSCFVNSLSHPLVVRSSFKDAHAKEVIFSTY